MADRVRAAVTDMTTDADTIIALYQRHGRAWAADRGDRLFEQAWLDRFRALTPRLPSILDLGCGAGKPIARYLIGHECRVTGIDSAPDMISMCAASFPDQSWHVGDMRTIRLANRFHGILAWDSFFHLSPRDQLLMFPVFRDHALPGAVLMFTTGPAYGERIGCLYGERLYHASLDADAYRALLREHGFEVVAHVVEDPACEGRTVWLAQKQ